MSDVGVKGINSQQVENFALDVFKCEQFRLGEGGGAMGGGTQEHVPTKTVPRLICKSHTHALEIIRKNLRKINTSLGRFEDKLS